MADVVMADDGIAFDGMMAEAGPLGGAETAFAALAEALAARGHRVEARSNCRSILCHRGVSWAPLASDVPDRCDLYIGNRGHRVIGLVPQAQRRLFWLHNPGRYLRKPRFVWPLLRYRPVLVATGEYHVSTVPGWLPCDRVTIPYGVLDVFRRAKERDPPPPIAVFASNPLRGLGWLLDLWVQRIAPAVPHAELHIYAGAAVYRGVGDERARQMESVLARADGLAKNGVWRHPPVGREALAQVLAGARLMLYRGDPGETFCLALAEAQAMGVPAVVQPIGSVVERVIDGETGHIAATEAAFAEAAVRLLRDDELWHRYHRATLSRQRGASWDAVAAKFEALM